MKKYIALLRGINVGGNKKIKMEDLRKKLKTIGYENIQTILASGNVVFDAEEKETDELVEEIEELIEREFGFPVPAIVVTAIEMNELKEADPFKDVVVTKDTRLYVSFLPKEPKTEWSLPYKADGLEFEILAIHNRMVCSVLTLQPKKGTIDAMSVLDKKFGKHITTRNWNTVEKILKLL